MPHLRLAFLGYGNVGRALHALLADRRHALRHERGITYEVTGVASRGLGWRAHADALDPDAPTCGDDCADVHAWLARARPDVVLESIALDPRAGQPALDYLRAALAAGAHAVSANKGPVVHGYHELARLAASHGRRYRFESAVMDGAPVFDLARHCLPLAGLRAVSGVFTSTATVVLEAVEQGGTIADGIARAQRLGIAEADPAYDVEGWDSVVKLCALAAVLFDAPLRPDTVPRTGIAGLDPVEVRRAAREGSPVRLVGRLQRDHAGQVSARVAPELVTSAEPLAAAHGTTLVMHYDCEVFPGGLTVTSVAPDLRTTAYGMLADLVDVAGSG